MVHKWDIFEVVKISYECKEHVLPKDATNGICGQVEIDKKDMQGDLGVECVVVKYDSSTNEAQFLNSFEFNLVKKKDLCCILKCTNRCAILIYTSVQYEYSRRMWIFHIVWILLMFVG